MSTMKDLMNLKDAIDEFRRDLPTIPKQVGEEIAAEVYDDIGYIFDTYIDKWYDSYKPRFYKRTYALKNVYKLEIRGICVSWIVGPYVMPGTHRGTNKYIYNLTFEGGFHGGAVSGPNHPSEGTPWYRVKTPNYVSENEKPYRSWSKNKAEYTFSPASAINRELDKYEKNQPNITGHTMQDLYDTAIDLVFGRYRLFK